MNSEIEEHELSLKNAVEFKFGPDELADEVTIVETVEVIAIVEVVAIESGRDNSRSEERQGSVEEELPPAPFALMFEH